MRLDNCNYEDLQTANIATILAAGEMRGLNFYTFEAKVLQQITHYSASKRFEHFNSRDFSSSDLKQSSYLSQISKIISVEKNLSYGEISDFCKEFDKFMEFYRKYAVFALNLCGENLCGEKMTNMRSGCC